MDEEELAGIIAEQRLEIEFLKQQVARLKDRLAIRPDTLFDMLKRRGFSVYKKERMDDVVIPPASKPKRREEFYGLMKKYSFRLFLRDVIKLQDGFEPEYLVKFSSAGVVDGYTEFLVSAGLVERVRPGGYRLRYRPVTSFGPTLEWFVAELLRREYMTETVWGVKFKGAGSGGDYDIIAALEGRLMYAEVKSSPPKQIYDTEVRAFFDRYAELSPDLALFIVDTELRMKDKVVVLFEQVMPGTRMKGKAVERLKAELFHVDGRIFIVNSKVSLAANIGEVLGWYLKRSANAI